MAVRKKSPNKEPPVRRVTAPSGARFTLQTGVEMPSGGPSPACPYPFADMKAGESFGIKRAQYANCGYHLNKWKKQNPELVKDRVFSLRQMPDRNYRVFRVK